MKRWIILILSITGGLGFLASCGTTTATPSISDSRGVMSPDQTLDLATAHRVTTLDPDRLNVFGRLNNTVEGLYQTNRDGQAQLALAKRVRLNAAKTTYTFTLRADARWSNGDPITAQDFVFSWRRAVATANRLLTQPATRRAISQAIDRRALAKATYGRTSLPAQGIVPAGLSRGIRGTADFAHAQPEQRVLQYHPAAAKRAWQRQLRRAGLTHVTWTLSYQSGRFDRGLANQLRRQLEARLPGLKLRLQHVANHATRKPTRLSADLNLQTLRARYADPLAMLAPFTQTGTASPSDWASPTYDRLVNQASTAATFSTARWQALLQADGLLMRDQGVTPLIQPASTYLVSPQLNGVQANTVGTQANFKEAYFVK